MKFINASILICAVMTGTPAFSRTEESDSIKSRQLQEVVVEGDNTFASPTMTTYIPTPQQKNIASNLVSLIDLMGITELRVTPDNLVKTISGNDVSLFIDYMPATEQEINGVNVRDVPPLYISWETSISEDPIRHLPASSLPFRRSIPRQRISITSPPAGAIPIGMPQ